MNSSKWSTPRKAAPSPSPRARPQRAVPRSIVALKASSWSGRHCQRAIAGHRRMTRPLRTPSASDDGEATDDASGDTDAPPERAPQDDEPWEEALPLNSVSVGDIVLPAIPATPSAPSTSPSGATSGASTPTHDPASPFEQGRSLRLDEETERIGRLSGTLAFAVPSS